MLVGATQAAAELGRKSLQFPPSVHTPKMGGSLNGLRVRSPSVEGETDW